jgi:hypothetical protein
LRGTSVLNDHEQALIELCSQVSSNDAQTDECVLEFVKGGYSDDNSDMNTMGKEFCDDDDTDCMLDSMFTMWEQLDSLDDLPTPDEKQIESSSASSNNSKVKPWSSRSSPSGTYVRDPATGEMKNITPQ